MSTRAICLVIAAMFALVGSAPKTSDVPPLADADIALSDGRTLHVRELPLGRMDGVVRDGARYDRSGTRVAFLAAFPSGAIEGDWRRTDPTQAYLLDIARRTLVALTSDGQASAVRWVDDLHVQVTDRAMRIITPVERAVPIGGGRSRVDAIAAATEGTLVSPLDEFRLQVFKTSDGGYAIGQVGAVRLRTIAVAPDHRSAVVGSFIVWIDGVKNGAGPIARDGADTVLPPSFAGSAYGDALTPLLPLGHVVYQAAYRNGVAYFAFSYGLSRIVASTTDFANYAFPALPKQPAFNVGDGLGAGADGVLYFADPENGVLQYWHAGRYVERSMLFPDGVSQTGRLFDAMRRLSPADALSPAMRPDADALDSALLEWRIYPVGDATGPRWIASYLGRAYIAGDDLHFHEIAEPRFPFAVLGRTDDGRIWAAAPQSRITRGSALLSATASLMYSRDGQHWATAAMLDGDPGAVGLHDGAAWAALTAFEGDASGVEVARITDAHPHAASTGAIYAGEDLFFADVDAGWYLICGGEPATRADDASGPLVALRLDGEKLFTFDGRGHDVYLRDRLDPLHVGPSDVAQPFLEPSVAALTALASSYLPTLAADPPPGMISGIRSLSLDAERAFEIEYAWRPYPLARVDAGIGQDAATIRRSLYRGPLAGYGQTERWSRDAAGAWHLSTVLTRWRL